MPLLNEIITINISERTAAIQQAGFGSVLFLGFDAPPASPPFGSDDVKIYSGSTYSEAGFTGPLKAGLDAYFGQTNPPARAYVGFKKTGGGGDATATAALQRIAAANNDWYCIIPRGGSSVLTPAVKKLVADYAQANSKIAFIDTDGAGATTAATTTDIAHLLKTGTIARAAAFWNKVATESLASAAAGLVLPTVPGALAPQYKKLSGVTAGGLTGTQITALDGKNANYFDTLGGQNVWLGGKLGDGGFIDARRDIDWLRSAIQTAILNLLINQDKIPYTNAGVQTVIQTTEAVLTQAESNGVLREGWSIAAPDVDDIPVNDRASRKLPNITVNGNIVGAVYSVTYNIVIEV